MSSPADRLVVFVGTTCIDIVLDTPTFPAPDSKTRLAAVHTALGGNAANSAVVARQLLPAGVNVAVVSAVADVALDTSTATAVDKLAAAGVSTDLLVAVAGTGMPTSYVVRAGDTQTRTILHHRTIREYTATDLLAAMRRAAPAAAGEERADGDMRAALASARLSWLHAEGRSVEATQCLLAAAREIRGGRAVDAAAAVAAEPPPSESPAASVVAAVAPAPAAAAAAVSPIVSVELERPRPDGDALAALAPHADVVFVSREYCSGWVTGRDHASPAAAAASTASSAAGDGSADLAAGWQAVRACQRAVAAACGAAAVRPLVVMPWGATGAFASGPADMVTETGASVDTVPGGGGGSLWWELHVPAHAPAGGVVDTIGAGDAFNAAFVAAALHYAGGMPQPWRPPSAVQVARWLQYAVMVAGEKCGREGLGGLHAFALR